MGVDKEKITPETSFVNDLGADSLDTVELVMELEEEFDINIPNEDSQDIEFSDDNLFDDNHFSGYDRVEGGARVNYGVRGSANDYKLSSIFL